MAFGWAQKNRDALRLPVTLVQGDLFAPLPPDVKGTFDVVVSNPPYIATGDQGTLPVDVVAHEPHEALFSGEGGLDVIRRIAAETPDWIRAGGWLLLEIGETQGDSATALLERAGWHHVMVRPDLADRPRVVEARWPE